MRSPVADPRSQAIAGSLPIPLNPTKRWSTKGGTLGGLLTVLWRHRLAFFLLSILSFAGLVSVIFGLPKQYIATSLLALDARPMRSVVSTLSRQESREEPIDQRVDPSVLATETAIITSRATIVHMLKILPVEARPNVGSLMGDVRARIEQWLAKASWLPELGVDSKAAAEKKYYEDLISRVAHDLHAEVPRTSSLIEVSYRDPDPVRAATIVNAVVTAYLQDQVEAKRVAVAGTISRLQARLGEVGRQVEEADEAVQDFRRKHDLLNVSGVPANTQRLNDVAVIESRMEADLAEGRARFAAMQKLPPERLAALQPASNGPGALLTTQLLAQQEDIWRRISAMESKVTPSDRNLLILKAQAAEVQRQLADQGRSIMRNTEGEVQALALKLTTIRRLREATRAVIIKENDLDAQLLRLTTEAASKRSAYDAFLTGFTRVSVLENSLVPDIRIVQPATPPFHPAISRLVLVLLSMPTAGILGAAMVLLGNYLWSSKAKGQRLTESEFEWAYSIPVFGITPVIKGRVGFSPATLQRADVAYSDALRSMRDLIDLQLNEDRCHTLAIVSAVPSEGKSALTVSLATAWASGGMPTLVIDCDVRRSGLRGCTDNTSGAGLIDYLNGDHSVEGLIQTSSLGFDVLPVGSRFDRQFYRISEQHLRGLVAQLSEKYQRVLLDLPPILAGSEALIGAVTADLTIFVSQWDGTPQSMIEAAIARLRGQDVKNLGAVLTKVDIKKYSGAIPYFDPRGT
jgi:polysaccharide biosynthesis transport protein